MVAILLLIAERRCKGLPYCLVPGVLGVSDAVLGEVDNTGMLQSTHTFVHIKAKHSLEFAMLISLTSLGSSQTFRKPTCRPGGPGLFVQVQSPGANQTSDLPGRRGSSSPGRKRSILKSSKGPAHHQHGGGQPLLQPERHHDACKDTRHKHLTGLLMHWAR